MSTPDDAARAEAERLYADMSYQFDGPGDAYRAGYVSGAAWQRAQIDARRDEVARAMYEADANKALEMGYDGWPTWSRADEITRGVYTRRASAALAALGVSDR